MANGQNAIKHLPLLHNPLLNAIFNNPFHATSPTKHTIREIAERHSDFTILVPPSHVLRSGQDSSKRKLADLCYNDDEFLRSHIIISSAPFSVSTAPVSKAQLIIYNTMNGRQVLLRGGAILTGKNFKSSIRVKILSVAQFVSFCDYFPKGSRFLLLFIEDTLLHNLPQAQIANTHDRRLAGIDLNMNQKHDITFEDLLRNYPVLSKYMSHKFYTLFHHNNRKLDKLRTRQIMSPAEIANEFRLIESEAFAIIQDCVNSDSTDGDRVYTIFDSVAAKNPKVDMNQLIHEYVELNLYDKVWLQLIFQYSSGHERSSGSLGQPKVLTSELYKDLSCLSLNQLDIPVQDPWKLNVLQRRIIEAITVLSKLLNSDVSKQRTKIAIIGEAISALTGKTEKSLQEDLVIDADTFIGLLIMVVVHSKINDLEAHLDYIRFFGGHGSGTELSHPHPQTNNQGYLNYVLSNFDAVIYLLSSTNATSEKSHVENMIAASALNYNFWYAIKTENISELTVVLEAVKREFGDNELPRSHFLKSKNINGESFLTSAIKTKNVNLFRILFEQTSPWISFEEIMFDRNTTSDQNLLMIALQEEASEIASVLIYFFQENATEEELVSYYNSCDKHGRTVGHYLSHNLSALELVGSYINWEIKDNILQTPLAAVCRCYDRADYKELIKQVFAIVFKQNDRVLTFDNHIDKAGNSLLHVLAKGLLESELFSNTLALVDVNQMNNKQLTPMSLYVRYSRTENLEIILRQKSLVFAMEDPKLFYNVLDYYSFSASKLSTGSNGDFPFIQSLILQRFFSENFSAGLEKKIGFLNSRFDSNSNEWLINSIFTDRISELSFKSKYISIEKLYQLYHYQKRLPAINFFPHPSVLLEYFMKGKSSVPMYLKFRMNRNLEYLNAFLASLNYLDEAIQNETFDAFSQFFLDHHELKSDFFKWNRDIEHHNIECKLTHTQISEIVYFVEYSLDDVRIYLHIIKKLRKLTTVCGLKQCEQRNLFDRLLLTMTKIRNLEESASIEYRDVDRPYERIEPFLLWLELCSEEILRNCGSLLNKVTRWRTSYSKIKELNNELHHIEQQIMVVSDSNKKLQQPEAIASPPLSRQNSLSVDLALTESEIPDDTSFFNFGLVDSKRARYKKLLLLKADGVKRLMDLNNEIKLEHEQLAASISQFISFRTGYLALALKLLVNSNLNLLRYRVFELTKYRTEIWSCPLRI